MLWTLLITLMLLITSLPDWSVLVLQTVILSFSTSTTPLLVADKPTSQLFVIVSTGNTSMEQNVPAIPNCASAAAGLPFLSVVMVFCPPELPEAEAVTWFVTCPLPWTSKLPLYGALHGVKLLAAHPPGRPFGALGWVTDPRMEPVG